MASNKQVDYTTIDRPYDASLDREGDLAVDPGIAEGSEGGGMSSGQPPVVQSGQSMADIWIETWIKSRNYQPKVSGFFLDGSTGYAELVRLYVGSGGIIGGKLDIPDTTTANSFHVDTSGNTWWGANVANGYTLANAYVLNSGQALFKNVTLSTNVTLSGIQSGSELAIQGWGHTMVFSITDLDTVAWSSGVITLMDGTTFAIGNGNTGNMSAQTYIYFDKAVSQVALQTTTTAATAVGSNKILIAVAKNGAVEPTYKVFSSNLNQNIDAADIVASSITANEIAANTITANKMSVSQLSAITADLGAITAGTITIDTAGYIRGNQTAYDTGTGFFLGYSGAAYKFSIGVGGAIEDNLRWDGTNLFVNGAKAGQIIRAYTAGEALTIGNAVILQPGSPVIHLDGSTQRFSITDGSQTGLDITGDITILAWINVDILPSVAGHTYAIASKDNGATNRSYALDIDASNQLRFQNSADGTNINLYRTAAQITSTGTWYHVAVAVDVSAEAATFYVNGSAVGDSIVTDNNATSIYNGTAEFQIGQTGEDANQWFDGMIDDVRVYDYALTAQEISDTYQSELVGNETGLKGYWQFSYDGLDETSNNNDLTNEGSTPFELSGALRKGEVRKSDASVASTVNSFIGFVQETVADGVSCRVLIGGVDENQSGLTFASQYYLSDTAGAISSSVGTVTRKCGIAVSDTEILITNIW